MGIYDRDYYGESDREHAAFQPRASTWVARLIVFNVVMFLLAASRILPDSFWRVVLLFPVGDGFFPTQLLTWSFVQPANGLRGLIFNSLMLYCWGSAVEDLYPRRRFLVFLAGASIVAGLAALAGAALSGSPFPMGGAHGIAYALMTTFVLHYPHARVFGLIPAWLLVGILAMFDLYGVMSSHGGLRGGGAPLVAAFAGGAVFGGIWRARAGQILGFANRFQAWRQRRRARVEQAQHDELDRILDKINREGMTALTEREKDVLKRSSEKYRNEQ